MLQWHLCQEGLRSPGQLTPTVHTPTAISPHLRRSSNDQSVDDMWAGWCAKVICDHLGYGHKTGIPYVRRIDNPTTFKAVGNIGKDSKALMWQVGGAWA